MATPDVVLECIWPEDIETKWPALEPLLRRGYARCGVAMEPEYVKGEAWAGRRLLWAIYEREKPLPLLGAAATRIAGRTCIIDAMAGRSWMAWGHSVLAEFERLAKSKGMRAVQFDGRFGWERVLPDYKPIRITLEKVLS